ncbi:MAG: hypothetical protein HOO99_10345 [Hyphomicrobiaceae bacterium]|nr:hypothetical protein [Hyphomicrobiaceae bacterium]
MAASHTTKRAAQRPVVTWAMAAALSGASMLASRFGLAIPAAWVVVALVWLGVRWALFETGRRAEADVLSWLSEEIPDRPEENIAWPRLAIMLPTGERCDVRAPVGFYEYEFEDTTFPATLPIRYHVTPLGLLAIYDDRSHVITGPALFAAVAALVWSLWGPVQMIWARVG